MKSVKRILSCTLLALLLAQTATACTSSPSTNPSTTDPVTVTSPASNAAPESSEDTAPTDSTAATEAPTEPVTEPDTDPVYDLVVAEPGTRRSSFRLVYDEGAESPLTAEVNMLRAMILSYTGADIRAQDASKSSAKEIVLCAESRPETAEMLAGLQEGEYAIRTKGASDGKSGQIFLAATTYRSFYACAEYLLDNYYTPENGLCVPTDLDVKGTEKEYTMITTTINKLRDPCILVEDGVYYAYGTGWTCYKNTSGNLEGPWEKVGNVASVADRSTDGGSHWAPEVHKYNGAYYMFTTYLNKATGHRGCTIMKSDSPEGPFVEITGGHITPADWDAIDGTLYVDPDGQPWMVFVHEWTSMPNNVGSFAAAKLSEDFTHFISEPMELFLANEPSWAVSGVTDGCWMYTTAEGDLLMVWSNFDAHGYTVAVARSSNGRLDGEWIHEEKLLYSKYMTGTYDGGHGMIFTDTDGQMYLSFHSPNTATGDRKERPTFLAIREENGQLVWDEPVPTEE